jgi:hypothetical protein
MEPIQLVIAVISIILTILFIILGVQVYFILKEFRVSVKKINGFLSGAESITQTLTKSASDMASLASGLKVGLSFVTKLLHKKGEDYE